MKSELEIWKPVKDYEERYQISNFGRFKSLGSTDILGRVRLGRIMKQGIDRRGYLRCYLSVKGIKSYKRTHQLVAMHFISNPKNLPQVNHKDGNKIHNYYLNLEWVTNSQNQKHAISMGLKTFEEGENHANFKGDIEVYDYTGKLVDVLQGNKDMKSKGYDFRLVSACLYGKRNTHRGMRFNRKNL